MNAHYDILIVGGGLTGLSLACALRHLLLRIGIIDPAAHPVPDTRSIALSYGSQQLFEKQKVWPQLAEPSMPIKQVHVSDQGQFGITRFTATEARVPALGYVIPLHTLQNVLLNTLSQTSIEWIQPASVCSMTPRENSWELNVQNGLAYSAKLVVAADGANSTIRQLQNISVIEQYTGQTAIIANIEIARPHAQTAYERFTPTGTIALLPIATQTYSLIWTMPDKQATEYLALDPQTFLAKLQAQFGYRLGRFTHASPRSSYVLKQCYAEQQVKPGLVLLGNAAHTLHPIAAQGFNLGLRDIDCLANIIAQAVQRNHPVGDMNILEKYASQRIGDQKRLMQFTHGLVRLFSKTSPLIRIPCNLGLLALDLPSPLKTAACRYGMGISG